MKKAKTVHMDRDKTYSFSEYQALFQHGYSSALFYVTSYQKTSKEIKDKMFQKGYIQEPICVENDGEIEYHNIVEEIVEKLINNFLIDDEEYVKQFVESKTKLGWGMQKIKMELSKKGIHNSAVENIVIDDDIVFKNLRNIVEKIQNTSSYNRLETPVKKKQKIVQNLSSKGFGFSEISAVLEEVEL